MEPFCKTFLLTNTVQTYDYFKNALTIRHARLLKLQNKPDKEISLELTKLKYFSPSAVERIIQSCTE